MTDNMSIWIDGTPYDWDELVDIVRATKAKGRKEPVVTEEFFEMVVRYEVKWEDGEIWCVSVHDSKALRESDPMHGQMVEIIDRHHKPFLERIRDIRR
jgi:hypothetical protein